MPLQDSLLACLAAVTRRVPHFRGLGTGYRMLNSVMIRCGVNPLVDAVMNDGTTVRVDLRTRTELDAFYRGAYDADLLAVILQVLDPRATFVDVGANVGFYSVAVGQFLRLAGAGGRVVAFEPLESNYSRLRENLAANGLLEQTLTYQLGLSNQAGSTTLTLREDFLEGGQTGNASIAINPDFDRGFATTTIALKPMDEVWHEIDEPYRRIGLVKLDIEGHEDFCLEGARATLQTYRPVVLMEVNKPYFRARRVDLDARLAQLMPAGYTIFRAQSNQWQPESSLEACAELDNVFLVPAERIAESRLAIFHGMKPSR